MTRRAMLAAIACAASMAITGSIAPAGDRREPVAPYLRALEKNAVGTIEGEAFADPRKPSAPPTPFEGLSALVVPYAPDVEERLDAIKKRQRDSIASYTEAHSDVAAVRAAYEHDLLAAGGGELIRGGVVDAKGKLRLEGVPEGEWLLLAWREDTHAVKPAHTQSKDAGKFAEMPKLTGYGAVSYWRMRVSVKAGQVAEVQLSDRSVWLTAVREEYTYPASGASKPAGKTRR